MTATTPPDASKRWLVLLAAFLGWMFDGLEMGLFPLIARPALIDMQQTAGITDPKFVSHWMGIVTALFLLGAACGGLVFGWLGDRIGRVRAMAASILTYSLFTGLVYFAETPTHLGALRFVAALGMGGEWSLGVALVMEVWPEKHRPILAGVIGAAANVGFLLIALVGMTFSVTVESWRWVALVGITPALLTFFIRLFVPESAKWQHAASAERPAPVRELFASRQVLGRTILGIALTSVVLIGTWAAVQWLPLWTDRIVGPDQPKAKAYVQGLSAFGAVLGCLAGAWFGGRFGRKLAYFALCVLSLASCQLMFRTITDYGGGFLLMSFIVGGVTAAFYGWLPLYLPELFPTRVRATAQGVAYNAGRVFAAVGALQMGALVGHFNDSYAKAGAVVTCIYALGMVVIWLAPETKDRPLPE